MDYVSAVIIVAVMPNPLAHNKSTNRQSNDNLSHSLCQARKDSNQSECETPRKRKCIVGGWALNYIESQSAREKSQCRHQPGLS